MSQPKSQPEKQEALGAAALDIAHRALRDRGELREVVDTNNNLLKIEPGVSEGIKNTAIEYAKKIDSLIDEKVSSNAANAAHYTEMTKLYYRETFFYLANEYSDRTDLQDAQNEFAARGEELLTTITQFINAEALESGGEITSKELATFHSNSLKFRRVLRDQPKMLQIMQVILKKSADKAEKETAFNQLTEMIINNYQTEEKAQETLFFIIANLSISDRRNLMNKIKNTPDLSNFDQQQFLEEGNIAGALTVGDMEILNGPYTEEERKAFNDICQKAKDDQPGLRALKGGYGDHNIFDGVNSKSLGLIFADVLAGVGIATNAGVAIGSGRASDIIKNPWILGSTGWLWARHQMKEEGDLISQNTPETIAHEKAKTYLLEFQENTLAFEDWDDFIGEEETADTRIKLLQEFTNQYLSENDIVEIPIEITPGIFLKFLEAKTEQDASYKMTLDAFNETFSKEDSPANDPKLFARLLFSLRHLQLNSKPSNIGIQDAKDYKEALDLIQNT